MKKARGAGQSVCEEQSLAVSSRPFLHYRFSRGEKRLKFEILGQIDKIEIIAVGRSIHDLAYLQKRYGPARWRKLKGKAHIKLPNGNIRWVELHWYEAHGIGRKDIKIKHYLE